jgi:hypothetical protein
MNPPMYHIEDLETLLLQKEYSALLEDEKRFVLHHISDETQYNQMRALLLRMIEESQEDEHWLEPDPSVKAHLDTLFEQNQKETPIVPFYQNRLFWSLSGVAALFLVALLLYWPTPYDENTLAQVEKMPSLSPSEESTQIKKNSTDNSSSTVLVPKPPMVEEIQFTDMEITEEEVSATAPNAMNKEEEDMVQLGDDDMSTAHAPQQIEHELNKREPTSVSVNESALHNPFLPQYIQGEQALMNDTRQCVQRALEEINWDSNKPSFKIYAQLAIDGQGKINNVLFLRGGENLPELRKAIQKEMLTGLGLFIVPTSKAPSELYLLNLPLNIHIQ